MTSLESTSSDRGSYGKGEDLFWWAGQHGPLRLAFTSVQAGTMSVSVGNGGAVNRRALEHHMHVPSGTLKFLHQVHSADVIDACQDTEGTEGADGCAGPIGDAWLSADAQQPLAIMTADCLPVLLAGRRPHALRTEDEYLTAAAHAGRLGLLGGVLENSVAALRQQGAQEITAWIGPAACGDCYEVPQHMMEELAAARPALASRTRWGTAALNLRAEAARVLQSQGVVVVDVFGCTIEDPQLYSHRASQQTAAPEGRIAGLIWRR